MNYIVMFSDGSIEQYSNFDLSDLIDVLHEETSEIYVVDINLTNLC